jgi:uncharacterized protein YndB with AHSA1/START domain
MSTDRIEKSCFVRAPLERVWRAFADSAEFGGWFGMRFESPFAPGRAMRGVIVPTTADPEVAEAQKAYEGIPFEIVIERMEANRVFSFRWHPGAVDPGVDYSAEPATLVAFSLKHSSDGVTVTVAESGFDSIPLTRRAKAYAENEQGWNMMVKVLQKHLAQAP